MAGGARSARTNQARHAFLPLQLFPVPVVTPVLSSSVLMDDSMVNRAAPPGSMRYFSLLYAPADRRATLTALYIIEAEIRESVRSPNHDVAHTRLQWWRAEVERLVNGAAQHPATRALIAGRTGGSAQFAKLHELIVAADMDLARMTYSNAGELRAYCARAGGALAELVAMQLIEPQELDEVQRTRAQRIGVGVRQTEMVRDLRQDVHDGRLYVPLDALDARGLTTTDLRASATDTRVKDLLRAWRVRIDEDLRQEVGGSAALRPLHVLAALHRRLLDRIAAHDYDVATRRVELGPVEKPWIAWRAARRT